MRRLLIRPLLILACSLGCASASADIATIHMLDGSQIRGEVVSLKGGNYDVMSQSLGRVTLKQSDVRLVEYGANESAPTTPNAHAKSQIQGLQSQMLSDPSIVAMIQSLKNDPSLQAIATDSEIQSAIASGNFELLMNHPKFRALMNNDTVREITRKMQ